ncbi:hypothetical protein OG422_17135 [Streptomyces sp. NBC_01525]|uniref:Lipoprotein n=1 Tax=Streptomyces benahoarensis TaxID=2595054 RepID=A0A553ZA64_9ACTN|nr:hypothetical protein [Streptomyces benahoarensis]TSB18343.1 hypothetical protein FNJ62_24440 [Streptomyces benahoarensis]TSB38297.1 hypothetical protein FNZ23_17240 [Streptomyces benahoarensis]
MFSATPTKRPAALIATAAVTVTAALGLSGCSVDASKAKPTSKTFPYTGSALKLTTHEVATKVVATDRKDIKVTRWFDAAAGTEHLVWRLTGDTLDIDSGCNGIAFCDAKFKVEVPKGITVTKDGTKTLEGRR